MSTRRRPLIPWLILACLCPLAVSAAPRWIPLAAGPEGGAPLVTVESTGSSVLVDMTVPGLYADDVDVDDASYTVLEVPECGQKGDVGHPWLPFRSVLVPLANGLQVRSVTVSGETVDVLSGVRVIPARAPEPDCGGGVTSPLACDPEVYSQDRWLPAEVVPAVKEAVVRGQRFLLLELSPLQFNPSTGAVVARPRLEVRIGLGGAVDQAAEELKLRRFKSFFPTLLDQPAPAAAGRANPTGVEYLIIAHDTLTAAVAPLAEWKRLEGYTVEIVPMSVIGTTSAQIKTYLQNRYNTDPDLTYVLLVGDQAQVPAESSGGHVTDLYYSCLDGSDYLADVVIGRLSVQTPTQCSNVVDKILAYERTPDQGGWHGDFLMAAYLQDYDDSNCIADRWFYETGTHIMHFVRDTVGLGIYTAATSDHLGCNPYRYQVGSYPHRPAGYSGANVPTADAALITSASTSTQDVTNAINAGVTIVQHRDHGGENGWGDPPYSNTNVNALTNGTRTPVVFSTNCLTGAFAWSSGDCFAEAFMKKYPGGAVGVMAATDVSYSGYNDLLAHGTYDNFWDVYDAADGGNIYPHSFSPAVATLYGKYYMYHWEGSGGETQYQCEIFHWHGDPEMLVYTAPPVNPSVGLDSTLPVGSSTMTVTCDAAGATVAVTENGTLLGRAIVSGGSAVVTLDPPPEQPIELDVVVTGHNLVPWEGTCQVIVPEGPWLVHRSHTLDDSGGGDGDGVVNPGESLVMAITVENVGAEAGTGLAGTLSSSSGHCTVTDPTATFPNLGVNVQGTSLANHFAFSVDGSAPNGYGIPFTLAWTAAPSYTGSTSFSVPVCEHLLITNVVVSGITEQSAVVTWTTNVPATSRVHYGTSSPPGLLVESSTLTTSHSLPLQGLTQCTTYKVAVGSASSGCYDVTDNHAGAYYRFTTGSGAPLSVTATDTPVSIPDANPTGATSHLTVSSAYPVSDVNVLVNITHTYTADLALYLIGPDATQVELSSGNGGSGDNYTNTLFDDEATQSITAGSAPFTGSFTPEQPLTAFDGKSANGTWSLKVVDSYGQDIGSITGFRLDLVVAEPCPGLFIDGFEDGTANGWGLVRP